MAYQAILWEPSPNLMVNTPFARHRQTFKAREYVAFGPPTLRVGGTLHAFLPEKLTITEKLSGIEIEGVEYLAVANLSEEQKEGKTVQDVIVLGEVKIYQVLILNAPAYPRVEQGHSSWGEFRIIGRVRPYDGLVCLLKDYVCPYVPPRAMSHSNILFLLW